MFTVEFWALFAIHFVLFIISHRLVSKKKKLLEKDNARLFVANSELTGKVDSLERTLAMFDNEFSD